MVLLRHTGGFEAIVSEREPHSGRGRSCGIKSSAEGRMVRCVPIRAVWETAQSCPSLNQLRQNGKLLFNVRQTSEAFSFRSGLIKVLHKSKCLLFPSLLNSLGRDHFHTAPHERKKAAVSVRAKPDVHPLPPPFSLCE